MSPDPEPRAGARDPILLVMAGPAGSGKSTLCDRLVAAGLGFTRVVTSTTRAPRDGEVNGVHYHFFTPQEFDARLAAGEFLEWAWVHGERRYGTLAASVLDTPDDFRRVAVYVANRRIDLRERHFHSDLL